MLTVLFSATAAALAVLEPVRDPDVFWHLASGEWMIDNGRLLDRDIFSSTRAGAYYSAGQWLGQLVLAWVFRLGGWLGIEILRALLVGTATLFLARAVLRTGARPLWASLPIVAALLVSRMIWGDRPQLFTLALFPVFLDLLLTARLGGGRALWGLPPLALLWANLHGAFPIGLALILAFTVESFIVRHPLRRTFGAVLVVSAVATQLNPAGPGALAWALSYLASPTRAAVLEEGPADLLSPYGLVFLTMLLAGGAAFIVLALSRSRVWSGLGTPILWAALIVPFALLGLAIQRQLPYACYVLAPFIAGATAAARGGPVMPPLIPRRAGLVIIAALAGMVVVLAAVAAPRSPDLRDYPVRALGPLEGTPGVLLNEYDWGGYLIHAAGGRRVFIDGRGGALYGPDLVADWYTAVRGGSGYAEVLARYGVDVVLLRPDRPLVQGLREAGWPVRAEEPGRWILLARP